MFIRILIACIFVLGFAGCATTSQPKNSSDQIQGRVTDLEKKLEEKDAEIVDLQYEVKDLSSKVGGGNATAAANTTEEDAPEASPVKSKSNSGENIIKVNASPEKIQNALKAAGVYTGKVDGKIGAGTKTAIIEFQKSHGLKADGVLGKKTWEELKAYLK